jgi:SAM-dependent methyltransferase
MVNALGLSNKDRVLDVGGGHNPLPAAQVILELDLSDGVHRDGQDIRHSDSACLIQGDVQSLPFADHAFDFVYCSHVLEHVDDPAEACKELMRVANRGFIETPRAWTEYVAGHPSHQWLVDLIDGVLVFTRKPFLEWPFDQIVLAKAQTDPEFYHKALVTYRNLTCVQLLWNDTFTFRVTRLPDGIEYRYGDPLTASRAHFVFACNLLLAQAPLSNVLVHAKEAFLRVKDPKYAKLVELVEKLLDNKVVARPKNKADLISLGIKP